MFFVFPSFDLRCSELEEEKGQAAAGLAEGDSATAAGESITGSEEEEELDPPHDEDALLGDEADAEDDDEDESYEDEDEGRALLLFSPLTFSRLPHLTLVYFPHLDHCSCFPTFHHL